MRKFVMALILLAFGIIVCAAQDQPTLTVFAAASLTDAFTDIGAAFEAANPDVSVTFNFAGSSTLAAQIAEGAPADVFASANERQMQLAEASERIAPPVQIFARNRLAVIVPSANLAGINGLQDLANPDILLVLAAPEVPVRTYTDTLLQALNEEYGPDYSSAVMSNLVSEETDVRSVVTKVLLGEADAGIVYGSDITPDIEAQITVIDIPDEYNQTAAYPIAALNDSPNRELTQAFIEFVVSDEGQAVLTEWGFTPACDPVEQEATPEAAETPLEPTAFYTAVC